MAEGKDKFWAEMTPKDQAAAKLLGWDSVSLFSSSATSRPGPGQRAPPLQRMRPQQPRPPGHPRIRAITQPLPVQKTWDDGDPEPMDGLFWESAHNEPPTTMTAAQIEAAQLLGHTTETWNHGMTQDDAATKIGAVFRGRKERKALAVRPA